VTKKTGDTTDISRAYSNEKNVKKEHNSGQKPLTKIKRQKRENKEESLYNKCG